MYHWRDESDTARMLEVKCEAPLTAGAPRRWMGAFAVALFGMVEGSALAAADLLPAEQAFRFSARALDDRTLEVRFAIADGYYLYRDKFKFAVTPEGAVVGAFDLPAGKVKTDEFFGKVETYRGTMVVKLPVSGMVAGQTVMLAADSQGCADVGVCYPPTRQKVSLALPAKGGPPGTLVDANPPKKKWFQ